jgi:DDE superfamily endonuclease
MSDPPRSRRKAGVWVLSVLVDDRRTVGAARADADAARQYRRPRRAAGEAPAPAGARHDLPRRARRHRLGGTDTAVFAGHLEHFLLPTLSPGMVVVVDNVGAHKADRIRELIEAAGCELVFLPPTRRTSPRSRRPSARSRRWSRRPRRAPGRPWTPRSPPHWTPSPQPMSPAGSHTPATSPDKLPENRCDLLRPRQAATAADVFGPGRAPPASSPPCAASSPGSAAPPATPRATCPRPRRERSTDAGNQ